MYVEQFITFLKKIIQEKLFVVGVPDSKLKAFCNYVYNNFDLYRNHMIAANEGNAVAIGAGNYLATQNIPIIYLQNSGLGNIVNPVESLLRIYKIPCVFIVGWRGEPGVQDEPQHIFQGKDTLKQLEVIDVDYVIIDDSVTLNELEHNLQGLRYKLENGKSIAFVIRKNGLTYDSKNKYMNEYKLIRENVLKIIIEFAEGDPVIATTGKTSREIFEIREQNHQSHKFDFLTVGSMGHSSSIALGIAISSNKRVWCVDGDGAAIMHLGAMAVIGANKPKNFIHILINNEAHESVGGLPTVAGSINLQELAKACGYSQYYNVNNIEDLKTILTKIKLSNELTFIEIKTAISSRDNLGRPTTSPIKNKEMFMKLLQEDEK